MNSLLTLPTQAPAVFKAIEKHLRDNELKIINSDLERPWGGFFVVEERLAQKFSSFYFPDVDFKSLMITGNLSPKILVVAPGKRLSWQYHFRRAEIWKLVAGVAGIVTSLDDVEGNLRELKIGEVIKLKQGERHRLVGLSTWGMVAEIWQHTDSSKLSDENDIVRLQDDFSRK